MSSAQSPLGQQSPLWQKVRARLDRLADEGRQARIWLRDDDAIAPTPALERLLAIGGDGQVPLLLAVIPAQATPDLAARLAQTPWAAPCQHGYAHVNHAPPIEKKREFGPDRPQTSMLAELRAGRARMQALFGAHLNHAFVPPWNRIDPALAAHLPALGFSALSTFGAKPPLAPGLPQVNARLDLMDWANRRGKSHDEIADALCSLLDEAIAYDQHIGILAHHLVHDEAAWSALAHIVDLTAGHTGAAWVRFDALIG